jgi:hypothetical protein
MKIQNVKFVAAISLLVAVFAISGNSQTHGRMIASVPFDFNAKGHLFTAGEYVIENIDRGTGGRSLMFRAKGGGASRIITMMPLHVNSVSPEGDVVLVFNRYGSEYFLSEVRNPVESFGGALPRSKAESNAAKATGEAKREIIAMKPTK